MLAGGGGKGGARREGIEGGEGEGGNKDKSPFDNPSGVSGRPSCFTLPSRYCKMYVYRKEERWKSRGVFFRRVKKHQWWSTTSLPRKIFLLPC